jgi:beta-glucosidase
MARAGPSLARARKRERRSTIPTHRTLFALSLLPLLLAACPRPCPTTRAARPAAAALDLDPAQERRIEELLARLSLEEKVGQMVQIHEAKPATRALVERGLVGSLLNVTGARETNEVQRLAVEKSPHRIPLLLGFDVIHGYKTLFPIPLAEAASFDPALVERAEQVAAREAAAAGLRWVFAPMVDIARDPRWGRIAEGAGEDPFLGAAMAAARVRGFQGKDPRRPRPVIACVKHFVGYGAATAGRDYAATDMSERTLREVHLPPFRAAVRAGVATLMTAFSDLSGVPSSANPHTLDDILRREWGFSGLVVSDWSSIRELIPHGLAGSPAEAARAAALAGVDMDMQGGIYQSELVRLVRSGRVAERTVDEAVRRILRVKLRLGLFESPYIDPGLEGREILSRENLQTALEMARASIVLLQNRDGLLPLRKDLRSLAVIGPLADDKLNHLGPWRGAATPERATTIYEALRQKLGARVRHARGCPIEGGDDSGFVEARGLVDEAEAVLVILGEASDMSGEAASRTSLELPGRQLALLEAVAKAGKPVALVVMSGRPLVLTRAAELAPALVQGWFLGHQAGPALAEVLLGETNPAGKLPVSFPRSLGQVPIFYAQQNTGRPASSDRFTSKYLDSPNAPLFAFGHGLSYTRFEYRDLRLSAPRIAPGEGLRVSVEVSNAGSRPGVEVVQLYLQDPVASVTRPVRELKGFTRVRLGVGERRRVELGLGPEELGLWNREMRFVVEPGEFRIWVGGSSEATLGATLRVEPSAH